MEIELGNRGLNRHTKKNIKNVSSLTAEDAEYRRLLGFSGCGKFFCQI